MKFRDQLAALIAEDKKKDAEAILDALDKQLGEYDADIKALKANLREKEGIKPEDFAKLEKERDELKATLIEAERNLKKANTDLKAATDSAGSYRERLHSTMRDDNLRKELVGQGVKKELLDAAHAFLAKSVQVDDEKNEAFAMTKDKDGKDVRQSLADFVKGWAGSDSGKAFIPAGGDSGGGAGGNKGPAATGLKARYQELNGKKPEELTPAEGRELVMLAGNPEVTKP